MTNIELPQVAEVRKLTRDEVRQKLLSGENSRVKRVPIEYNGVQLELEQPTVDGIMKLHERSESSSRIAHILIHHVFLPETNEHVFDDTDYDTLISLPYTPELTEIQEKMNNFLIGDDKAAIKN